MGRRRKTKHGPRRKRMDRFARLDSATATRWVEKYTGKDIVRGYCKWYAVDPLCAVIELRLLGVPIEAEREEELRRLAKSKSLACAARKKEQVEDWEEFSDSDETFAYIAGYTSSGVPFGVTWEEAGETPPWLEDDDSIFEFPPPTAEEGQNEDLLDLASEDFLGRDVEVTVDRPLGSRHPAHGFEYPVNYGFVPGTLSGDSEELDAYILAVDEPLRTFRGVCVAVIERLLDADDKLIVVPPNTDITDGEIRSHTHFQEQFFISRIVRER